jgi:hypothetical protein
MIRRKTIALSAILLMTAFFGQSIAITADTAQSANHACDRKCLSGFVTKYLDAMVAHRPGDVPVAANAHEFWPRFTLSGQRRTRRLALLQNIWRTNPRSRSLL